MPIGLSLAAVAGIGFGAWRYQREKTIKAWLSRTTVTAELGDTPDGHPGPLQFRAPPVGLTVRCAPGDGGPKSAIPIEKVTKHE